MFLLFLRFLPMIAIAEVKSVMPQAKLDYYDDKGVLIPEKVAKETEVLV